MPILAIFGTKFNIFILLRKMADNFFDTAERMRDASKLLHGAKHFHNACYTAGYVVECYLKVLLQLGVPGVSGNPKSFRHDIKKLGSLLNYAATSAASTSTYRKYILNVSSDCSNIIGGWDPFKRYEEKALVWVEPTSDAFQIEMERCYDMVVRMFLDKIIK